MVTGTMYLLHEHKQYKRAMEVSLNLHCSFSLHFIPCFI